MTAASESDAGKGAVWPRIAPFGVFIGLMVVEPYVAELLGPVLDPRWLYAIRSTITGLLLLALWRHYSELRPASAPGVSALAAGTAAGLVVFVLWINLDFSPLIIGDPESPYDPTVADQIHWGLALTRLMGAALVVPVMEELFWRSFLMRWLERPRFMDVEPGEVGWKALLITSAVFALEHRLWFAGFLAGLVYGELYRRTGSVWVVVLAHAITNGALGAYVLATGSWGFW